MLDMLRVASRSNTYFCSIISSRTSTPAAPCANERSEPARATLQIETPPRPAADLFIAKGHHRIDFHRVPRRNVTGEGCRHDEQSHDGGVSRHVGRGHPEEQSSEQAREAKGSEDCERDSRRHQTKALAQNHSQHIDSLRAERHPNSD